MEKLELYNVESWTVFGRSFFKSPFRITDSLNNEARIVRIVNGRSRLYSANLFTDLSSGDTLIMKADNFVNNWLENQTGELNQVIAFQLSSDFLRYVYEDHVPQWFFPQMADTSNAVQKADASPLLDAFFEGLSTYFNTPIHITDEIILLKVRELIALLVQTDRTGSVRKIFGDLFSLNEYDFQDVVQKHLFEDLNIEDLAFLSGMSLFSFKRKFSTVYGTSPNKYIITKRLEKAQTLLNTTELRISDIAYDCGFSELSYFSRVFKNSYNYSPSEFRSHNQS